MASSISNPPSLGGPYGSAYTQTFSEISHTHASSALSTSITIALLTEVAGFVNTTNAAVNELKKVVNAMIDDLQTAKMLQ